MTKVKVSSNNGANGNIENHNPNTTNMKQSTTGMMEKSSANSIESTQGSSGAAKYLINQLHLRPVAETTRSSGIEAPKILSNNSNHHHHHHHHQHVPSGGASHQSNSHSFSGG